MRRSGLGAADRHRAELYCSHLHPRAMRASRVGAHGAWETELDGEMGDKMPCRSTS